MENLEIEELEEVMIDSEELKKSINGLNREELNEVIYDLCDFLSVDDLVKKFEIDYYQPRECSMETIAFKIDKLSFKDLNSITLELLDIVIEQYPENLARGNTFCLLLGHAWKKIGGNVERCTRSSCGATRYVANRY